MCCLDVATSSAPGAEEVSRSQYWVVDPVEPRFRAWALREGEYVEVADVGAEQTWVAEAPFPVTIRPGDLVR